MNMTVKQLIAKLKKMPPNAYVGWQNHDQSDHEIDGLVGSVKTAGDEFYHHPEVTSRTEWLDGRPVVILGS
ncbi:MAG: hypothetical protein ACTHKQ_17885 [Mesorhizobium sp.]